MSIAIRLLLIVSSAFTVVYILRRIYKSQMRIQDSVFWILFSVVVLLLAVFPGLIIGMTDMLGVISPVNFVFLVFIFFSYIKLFSVSTQISSLENKIKSLTYEIAIQKKKADLEANDSGVGNERTAGESERKR